MKYITRTCLLVGILLLGTGDMSMHAKAADEQTLSESQLVQIRSRCSSIQATLSRIHANDALTRVNRGKVYEQLSTKLMTPFNSRVVLNRLDATALLERTVSYESNLASFRSSYQTYEQSLSALMRINCSAQPARFYETLQQVRENRNKVKESTKLLAEDTRAYKQEFTNFAKPYREEKI